MQRYIGQIHILSSTLVAKYIGNMCSGKKKTTTITTNMPSMWFSSSEDNHFNQWCSNGRGTKWEKEENFRKHGKT